MGCLIFTVMEAEKRPGLGREVLQYKAKPEMINMYTPVSELDLLIHSTFTTYY